MTDRAPEHQHDDPSALHTDDNIDVGSAAGSELPGVLAEPQVSETDAEDGITGPAADSTLGSDATGVDNLAGGPRTKGSGRGGGTSGVTS